MATLISVKKYPDAEDFPPSSTSIENSASSGAENSIQVQSLWKRYGRAKNPIISGLTLTVKRGHIYGLLGPSGCGKTTLLKCVVGRLRPDSGIIRVMGQRPGKLGHKVPGRLIGYMPQDLALYQEFTISETLFYFGRIFGMESEDILARVDFLVKLLKLPKKNKLIYRMSGGQQRRVSFACALLHEPPLLILDEPTVGVDPQLRQCIWNHLRTIVSNPQKPTSVLITTHYIEEAREGHTVALMRDGRLLAESSPDILLRLYNETSLESVFLILCSQAESNSGLESLRREKEQLSDSSSTDSIDSKDKETEPDYTNSLKPPRSLDLSEVSLESMTTDDSPDPDQMELHDPIPRSESLRSFFTPPKPRRIAAVVVKDFTSMIRRIGFLIFQFSLPVLQIMLFIWCIGPEPRGLNLAIVNDDFREPLSWYFLSFLDRTTIKKTLFTDLQSAREEVLRGKAWSVLHIGKNFSRSFQQRLSNPSSLTNAILKQSSIHMEMDNTNYQVSAVLRKTIAENFESFMGNLLQKTGRPRELSSLPVEYHAPLLGSKEPSFTEFMAPGMIITILFFLSTGLTAVTFVVQRKEGLLDRSLVAGVTALELVLGHILTELVIMSVQTALLLVVCLAAFQISCQGSVVLVTVLAMSTGFCGMALGLFISVLCSNENSAMQAALGTMYPCLLLSGIMWPSEAMPTALLYLSKALPTTLAAEAMRSIMSRGFSMASFSVWIGCVSSVAWSALLLLLSLLLIKLKGI